MIRRCMWCGENFVCPGYPASGLCSAVCPECEYAEARWPVEMDESMDDEYEDRLIRQLQREEDAEWIEQLQREKSK